MPTKRYHGVDIPMRVIRRYARQITSCLRWASNSRSVIRTILGLPAN